MKRLTIILIISFTVTDIFGQNFDFLINRKQVDCSDISYNSGLYFIKYLEENKIDSAKIVLQYWEAKCGMREPVYRAKILLAMKMRQFNDSLLKGGSLSNIFIYQDRMNMIKYSSYYNYDNYKSYYGFIPPGQEFDTYTRNLASQLKKEYQPESIEYLLTEFYSDNCDTILTKIQTGAYGKSALTTEYKTAVKRYANMPEYHLSWITGIWIPTGDLKKLGSHPELGFQVGVKHKKMNYDFVMTFKFMNAANDYYAHRTDSGNDLELTNHFFGGHIGIDVGRDIYANKGHEIQLTGGIAADGFDALEADEPNNVKSASAWSYNFNFGAGYRFYITNSFYIGLRAKYNVVDYSLNNVVDFTGNPITIQFIIGNVNNVLRNNNLKALKYRLRR